MKRQIFVPGILAFTLLLAGCGDSNTGDDSHGNEGGGGTITSPTASPSDGAVEGGALTSEGGTLNND